jgi:uncharacterized protein
MNTDALIIFCRYPEYGSVKTRIAASLGHDFTLGLYSAFLKDVLSISTGADKIIAVNCPEGIPDHSSVFELDCPVVWQKGENLGIRMLNAIIDACNAGYERVVLIGSDSPDLPEEIINNAFKSLHFHDAVLGPSKDGGYYLVGFKNGSYETEYFSGIEWGTSSVLRRTVEKINTSGKTLSLMPEWLDIDDSDDLKEFYDTKCSSGELSSYTMKYISEKIKNNKHFRLE